MTLPLPSNGKKFKQGIFKPKNLKKYIGQQPIRYLSAWELKFFRWADDNPNVVEWASEAVIIPYVSPLDQRVHRYYTDGIIAIKEGANIKKYIIEIKPKAQTVLPTKGKKRMSTMVYETARFAQNQAKWDAAKKWCDKHGYSFLILTEKELGIDK
jgi:DNA modification methylase